MVAKTAGVSNVLDAMLVFPEGCHTCHSLLQVFDQHKLTEYSDVHKRHSDRCSAALSLNEAAQPRLPVECTPHNMVNLAASLAIDRNTSESPLAPASLMQEQTMPPESSPLSYSSSAPSMYALKPEDLSRYYLLRRANKNIHI